jgi:hypothetical protein
MHDAACMRRSEPSRDLESDLESRVHGKSADAETRAQRLTFQALRHEVRGAVVLADVVTVRRWCD